MVVALFRPFTTPISFLIAFSQVPTVYVSAFIALVLFTRVMGGGRLVGFEVGQQVVQMVGVGIISTIFIFIPLALYGLTWIVLVLNGFTIEIAHLVSLGAMWMGIILNYFIGKMMARYLLID